MVYRQVILNWKNLTPELKKVYIDNFGSAMHTTIAPGHDGKIELPDSDDEYLVEDYTIHEFPHKIVVMVNKKLKKKQK